MPLTTFSVAALLQRTSDGSQWLGFMPVVSGVASLSPVTIAMPETLTPTYSFVRSLPSDRQILYICGIPTGTGFCDIYRYNGHTNTFSLLLHVSGALNFSCPVEIIFATDLAEHVFALCGTWNTRAQNFHQTLTQDAEAGVYESIGGSAFTEVGTGHEKPFNGANINHPNTLIGACLVPGVPSKIVTLHCQTTSGNPLHQAVIDVSGDGGVTFGSVPDFTGYVTGFMYCVLGNVEHHPEWSPPGYFYMFNSSGVGAYALPNQTQLFNADDLFLTPSTVGTGVLSGGMGSIFYDGSGNGYLFDTNGFVHIYQLTGNGAGITEIIPESSGNGAGWRSFATHDSEPTAIIGYQGLSGADGHLYFTTDGAATWTAFPTTDYGIIGLDFGPGSEPPPGNLIWPQSATWRDGRGETARTLNYVQAADAAAALTQGEVLIGAISDLTNARLEAALGAWTTSPIFQEPGSSGLYNSVEIKAVLAFADTSGGVINVEIPSPVAAVFQADGEIVDQANPGVIASVASILDANLCGRGGLVATTFLGGRRQKSPRKRTVTIYTLTPDESGPDD